MTRPIRTRDLIHLWARAAGLCSHPDCRKRLVLAATASDRPSTIGEAAHIVAHSGGGPRGDPALSASDRAAYSNLILLCANHHTMVDAQPDTYTVETLRAWKAEHEAWIEALTSGAPARAPWTLVFHEELEWICRPEAVAALGPGAAVADVRPLRGPEYRESLNNAAYRQRGEFEALLQSTPPDRRRFAVFSTAPIPLAVNLGFILGDRSRVALYQYDRDRGSWSWDESACPAGPVSWTASDCPGATERQAVIRVSLSAPVDPDPAFRAQFEIDIRVPDPSVRWLRAPQQLAELARVYEEALAAIRARRSEVIHLFYAGPAPGAIAFGRAYNPRMNPRLIVYEHRRDTVPPYEPAVHLNV